MGDRAVLFIEGASCAVYLHWGGSDVAAILDAASPTMRANDPDYATARLVAAACTTCRPTTGVGVLPPPADLEPETLKRYSHGDAGVFLIPAADGVVRTFAGYGFDRGQDGDNATPVTFTYRGAR